MARARASASSSGSAASSAAARRRPGHQADARGLAPSRRAPANQPRAATGRSAAPRRAICAGISQGPVSAAEARLAQCERHVGRDTSPNRRLTAPSPRDTGNGTSLTPHQSPKRRCHARRLLGVLAAASPPLPYCVRQRAECLQSGRSELPTRAAQHIARLRSAVSCVNSATSSSQFRLKENCVARGDSGHAQHARVGAVAAWLAGQRDHSHLDWRSRCVELVIHRAHLDRKARSSCACALPCGSDATSHPPPPGCLQPEVPTARARQR